MKIKSVTFACGDGLENQLDIVSPVDSQTFILCLPAGGVAAKHYHLLLEKLSNHGFAAACFDLRGNGRSNVRPSRSENFGYAHLAEQDLPAAIAVVKLHYPEHKLVLLGHSLGGQICSLYLSQNPNTIEHLILTALCTVYYKNWPSPYHWGLLLFSQASWLISAAIGYFPGRKLGFGGTEARGVMKDWAYNARTGDYKLADSVYNYIPFLPVPDLKVLAINFADDQLAPPTATDHLLAKLATKHVDKSVMSGADIGRTAATHFNWLRSPEYVATVISEYLSK